VRTIALFLLTAGLLLANTFKLYLKSGEYQTVREYKVEGDRVRYFSTERGDWEEIPAGLCDLKKTEAERAGTEQDLQKEAKLVDEEEKLERAQRKEVERIPMNPGAYSVENDQVKMLEYGESFFVRDKKRQILQRVTPIPIVAGKATLELKGAHASFVVHENEPEFYLRLEQRDRFGIVQLTPNPKKGSRIVENIDIAPVTNENFENPKQIPTFEKEVADGLYKVWPEKPLTPGEYALVEYTGQDVDMRLWDFAYQSAPSSNSPASSSKK
jgi:hypothetical protein